MRDSPGSREYILRVIMGQPDLQIEESIIQKDYKNMQGRSKTGLLIAAKWLEETQANHDTIQVKHRAPSSQKLISF